MKPFFIFLLQQHRHFFMSSILVAAILLPACNGVDNYITHKTNKADSLNDPLVQQAAENFIQGKALFEKHCQTCHAPVNSEKSDQMLFANLFSQGAPGDRFF